jgi:hypothetical protein
VTNTYVHGLDKQSKNKKRKKKKENTTQYVLDTTKQKHNTNKVNKTRALLQTIGGKDEPNIIVNIYQTNKC